MNHMLTGSFNAFEPIMPCDDTKYYDRTYYQKSDGTEVEMEDAFNYAWGNMTEQERQESIQFKDTQEMIIEWFYSSGEWSLRKEGEEIW